MPEDKLPTKEEVQKNTQKRWDSLEENLKNEFYMSLYGSNTLRKHSAEFGSIAEGIGETQYSESMQTDEAAKIIQKMYKEQYAQEEKERDELDMADMPEVNISSYGLAKYALRAVSDSIKGLPLSRLEKVLAELAPAIKPEIPQGIKDYEAGLYDLQAEAISEGKKPEAISKMAEKYAKANPEAAQAHAVYKGKIAEKIKKAAAYKVEDAHRWDSDNAEFKAISDAYNKSQEDSE